MLPLWLNTKMAIASLVVRPGRTALTLLGIVIGIVALVLMMTLIGGLKSSVVAAMQPLGTGVFQVQREPRFVRRSRKQKIIDSRKAFVVSDVEWLRDRLNLVDEIGGEMWSWGVAARTVERRTDPVCGLVGAMPVFLKANGLSLESGRFVTEHDIRFSRRVAVIGSDVAETLFPAGPAQALGETVRVKGQSFEVVGVMERRPALFGAAWRNSIIAIPVTTFRRHFGFESLHVTMAAVDPDGVKRAMDEAIVALRYLRGVDPGEANDFEIFSNESMLSQLDGLALALTAAAASICFLSLLVGGMGVMNILLVSVTERTSEIGLRKALGATPRTILLQFLSEAVVLTTVGGLIGIGLAQLGAYFIEGFLGLPADVPVWAVLLALVSSTTIGVLAGLVPSRRAARLHPIDALRQ